MVSGTILHRHDPIWILIVALLVGWIVGDRDSNAVEVDTVPDDPLNVISLLDRW